MVNGGDYAYVIRHDNPAAAPSRTDAWGPGDGPGQSSPSRQGPAQAGRMRAITTGALSTGWAAGAGGRQETASPDGLSSTPGPVAPAGAAATALPATETDPATAAGVRARPEAAPAIDPALAYGPDDPAYGPPGLDWYKRDEERAPHAGDGEPPAAAGEPPATRGPFEPLRPGDREGAGHADYQPADGEAAFDDPQIAAPESEISGYDVVDDEMSLSELFGFGTEADPEAGALDQIRGLYDAAESVSQDSLDRHFEQLLERQRELISEYFTESAGLGSAETREPAASADTPVPLGFDSAQSLTGLRGELRGAP
jgi:hypothetical protein